MTLRLEFHLTETLKYFQFYISTFHFPIKTATILILFLYSSTFATAQYAHPRQNNNGITTTESASGGDKMTIAQSNNKNSFTVDFQLTDPFNKAVLVVFDISGRVIVQKEIYNKTDQVIIPSDNWPTGQYTVSLFADKKTLMTKKIAIAK